MNRVSTHRTRPDTPGFPSFRIHDQDAEPPTPDEEKPDLVEPDPCAALDEKPGRDPDPDPGKSADQAGIDS